MCTDWMAVGVTVLRCSAPRLWQLLTTGSHGNIGSAGGMGDGRVRVVSFPDATATVSENLRQDSSALFITILYCYNWSFHFLHSAEIAKTEESALIHWTLSAGVWGLETRLGWGRQHQSLLDSSKEPM